jgi:6-phosphogluconate dehydrogenase
MTDFVASLERPRRVLIMVKAGPGTDAVIDELTPLMEPGDILIDAGNAHFPDTIRRERKLAEIGLHFVGTGVSGGEEGALNGPSIMPGGSRKSYESLGPLLESIAAQVDGVPCCTYVGPDGAGHFVKMVHNGIEYADMQLIAEAYDLIKQGTGASAADIAQIFKTWNEGDLESFLIEITAEVLGHVDAETGNAFVDIVLDRAEQKGTGRWTVQNALDLGVPITGIAEATFARGLSGSVPQREAARAKLTAGTGDWAVADRDEFVEDVRQALYASKVVAYSQGFDQIAAASAEYGWNIDRGAMARIWRGGCIIRARFLNRITEAYERNPDLALLLADDYFTEAVSNSLAAWRRVVAGAAQSGIPTPAFSSSLAYYDGIRAERLPAALIQAQRDFFGAHTYQRVDKEGTYHTQWSGDRTESAV